MPLWQQRPKTRPIIVRGGTFVCFVSGTTHYTNCRATCASRCVVYLATCGICNKQYVGNTTQALRKRVTGHRNGKDSALKEHLKFHENAGLNEVFEFSVITQTTMEHILNVETKWIRKMRSSEPFGLWAIVLSLPLWGVS